MDFMRTKYKEFSGGCGSCDGSAVNGGCEFCGKVNGGCEFCAAMGGNEVKEYQDETINESGEHNNSKFTNCMFEAGQKFVNCEFVGRNMITGDSAFTDCTGAGEVITTGNIKMSGGTYETVEHSGEIEMKSTKCTHIKICGKLTAEDCSFGSIDIWGDAEGCTEDAKVKLINCKYEKINSPVDKDVADLLEEINEFVNVENTDSESADSGDNEESGENTDSGENISDESTKDNLE
jgi:hypothetical protein